jgi:hypothetical protein
MIRSSEARWIRPLNAVPKTPSLSKRLFPLAKTTVHLSPARRGQWRARLTCRKMPEATVVCQAPCTYWTEFPALIS